MVRGIDHIELIVDVGLAPHWGEPSQPGRIGGLDYESLLREGSPDPFVSSAPPMPSSETPTQSVEYCG